MGRLGVILSWVLVRLDNSNARSKPIIVTKRADDFSRGVIVIIWVFVGGRLRVIIRPARILPYARRLIGLIISVLFSLIGEKEEKRGYFIKAKEMRRRL